MSNTSVAPCHVSLHSGKETDYWIQAYCDPSAPEIFSSITTPTEIWQNDPFDVETIHQEARERFAQLVDRALRQNLTRGGILLLLGESGSGKTHLMRAFRNYVHTRQIGYCAYMQMTSQTSNYARYLINYLIDSLGRAYDPTGNDSSTSLDRLSQSLAASIPSLSEEERRFLRDAEGDLSDMIIQYADRLTALDRFHACDVELLRIFLHIHRDDHRVQSRAVMWLRCQNLTDSDRRWIGQAVPRHDEADPLRMLCTIAQLIGAVQNVPLIFLIDQLEDLQNLEQPVEQFRRLVDTLTTLTDQAPNTIVVLACLEDYYIVQKQQLPKSKLDRLENPIPPIRLTSQRALEDIHQITQRRLEYLYRDLSLPPPPHPLYPITSQELEYLNNLRTRDILNQLRQHQERCRQAGHYVPLRPIDSQPPCFVKPQPPTGEIEEAWNNFLGSFTADVPKEEEAIAELLARMLVFCSAEMSKGIHFGQPHADRNFIEVETHLPPNRIDRLLIAVCNKRPQGGGFLRQLQHVQHRAGEIPVAIVRTIDFPKSGESCQWIARLLKQRGRRIRLHDTDLRYMLAFEAFIQHQGQHPHFLHWQQHCRPLTQLPFFKELLDLDELFRSVQVSGNLPPTRPSALENSSDNDTHPRLFDPSVLVLGMRVSTTTQADVTLPLQVLTQHMAFLGGTGSGKTTAALNLIEQVLSRGIPAILVDRKGDLSRYADPQAWEEPLANSQSERMRADLRRRLHITLYTPGNSNGCPLALPLVPNNSLAEGCLDRDLYVQHTAAALGAMMNLGNSPSEQAKLAILTKALELLVMRHAQPVTIPLLRDLIEEQSDELIAAVGSTYRDSHFTNLAERLQTLWVRYERLFDGPKPLDIEALLGPRSSSSDGKVRLTILCTRFLPDDISCDFWMAQFLIALGRWCGSHPSPTLQALLFLDEADVYLPAVGPSPATKGPLEHLLRRARSAGLGLFLATQTPGDFDYRCRENIRTWFVGRITQERALQKVRPMMESGGSKHAFDRLPKLETGEFYLVTSNTNSLLFRSQSSWIRTQQLPEERILQLARQTCS
mgnify:CR=1 FL=1